MLTLKKPVKQYYSDVEAAHALSISIESLYQLLDEHVFNAGHPRPPVVEFTHADLLLLTVWAEAPRGHNVVAMPNRG